MERPRLTAPDNSWSLNPCCIRHSPDARLEVSEETLGLVALHLSVLDGRATEEIVQLDGLVSCHTSLVLAAILTQPKVEVLLESATLSGFNLREDSQVIVA